MSDTVFHLNLENHIGDRLDKALAQSVSSEHSLSRARIQELIAQGYVCNKGEILQNIKYKVKTGDEFSIHIPKPTALELQPEDIPLDIFYEDSDILVINKPAGMVVHPGNGVQSGTLVHAVLFHAKSELSGIGGVERPGIVHRIDKDTSGLLVIAKNDHAHHNLQSQFHDHSVHRRYMAFVAGSLSFRDAIEQKKAGVSLKDNHIRIETYISRDPHNRLKMHVAPDNKGKWAATNIAILAHSNHAPITKIAAKLETGRTHQIRVHMDYLGFPLLGDPVYGRGRNPNFNDLEGQALHAAELGFLHPRTGEKLHFHSELPFELRELEKHYF